MMLDNGSNGSREYDTQIAFCSLAMPQVNEVAMTSSDVSEGILMAGGSLADALAAVVLFETYHNV